MSADVITITGIRPGLDIRTVTGCAGRKIPVADWLCVCGYHERATGSDAVRELCARANSGHCPHTIQLKEAA